MFAGNVLVVEADVAAGAAADDHFGLGKGMGSPPPTGCKIPRMPERGRIGVCPRSRGDLRLSWRCQDDPNPNRQAFYQIATAVLKSCLCR